MSSFLRGEDFIEDMIERVDDWQALPPSVLNIAFNLDLEDLASDNNLLSTKESWPFDAAEDFRSFQEGLSEIGYSLSSEYLSWLEVKALTGSCAKYFAVVAVTYFENYCLKKVKPEMDFTVNSLRVAIDALTHQLEGVDLLNISSFCSILRLFQIFLYEEAYQDKALYTQNTFQIDQFQKELKSLFSSRIDGRLPCFAYFESYPALPWDEEERTVLNSVKKRAELRSKNSSAKKSLFRKVFGL